METVNEEDIDTLASLEQRIQRAVEVLTSLRQENHALSEQLTSLKSENAQTKEELETARRQLADSDALRSRLANDLAHLRDERKHVKSRIEKLLGQMDLLSAG